MSECKECGAVDGLLHYSSCQTGAEIEELLTQDSVEAKNANETSEEWEKRHQGHVTEEFTPERPFEDRSLYCYDCEENGVWKGNKKRDE